MPDTEFAVYPREQLLVLALGLLAVASDSTLTRTLCLLVAARIAWNACG